jgi:hypothetical protein
LSDKIKLTQKQVQFLVEMTEIPDPEEAVDRFASIMIEERINPIDIVLVVDRLIKALDKKRSKK